MDDCAVVATTPSATLTALQARREAREQRQAGLFKRLSNLRSLKAQLFDIKQKHEGVVLTGGDDIFQNEVNSLVAEIDKLKAEREHETLTVEPRPLPPWLLVPGLASAPVRGVDDDFLNRLQQAEKRDAAAAADIAAISLATVGPIAAGAFSMIVRATDAAGATVAVKTFNKAKCAKDAGLATASAGELRVLRMLAPDAHDHLANLMHVHESLQSVHLVLEYCAGGSLQRRLQALQRKGPTGHSVGVPEAEAALMSRQLCSALAHMHTRGVAHRDVKPSNVLFVDGTNVSGGSVGGGGAGATRLKLCDFGFATFRPPPARCHTRCGTPIYMAPELHVTNAAGAGGKDGYLPAPVDCWALGALVFELLHAKPAFIAETMPELVRRVRNANHAPFAAALSSEAKDLIKALLTIKPAARCEAEQALEHAWLAASS